MVAGVEVDRGLLGQTGVAERLQAKQAAKRRNRSRRQAGQLMHFVSVGKTKAFPAAAGAQRFARQLAVGRQHEKDELSIGLANQGFSAAGQFGAANRRSLGARKNRGVSRNAIGRPISCQQLLDSLENRF